METILKIQEELKNLGIEAKVINRTTLHLEATASDKKLEVFTALRLVGIGEDQADFEVLQDKLILAI